MRKCIFLLLLILSGPAFSQTKQDSIDLLKKAGGLIDIQFTDAELAMMLEGVNDNTAVFKSMHQYFPANNIPYPFAFYPQPQGFKVPVKQLAINWNIPTNVKMPADKNDLAFYSIPQLASLIKNKKISSAELTAFFITRLKKWGDTLQCVVSITEDIAMQQAKQADAEIKKGIYKGPLHGIPYGLKDLFAVKGSKTTWGAMAYKDQTVNEDAFIYTQLKKAGAVLCAKLTLGALAMGDVWFGGVTKNPWNLKQGSSGSSAGSASATVAGLLPFAIGTETLGSIISPSARCGATGLRPTFGSVSRSGAMVLAWSLDKAGPICRSAEDAAIVFYYIKGTDGKDPSATERAFNYNANIDIKKIRIGYITNYFNKLDTSALQWNVLESFKKMGVNVQPVVFPDSAFYPVNIMDPIISSECAAAFDDLTRNNRDDLLVRQDPGAWPNFFRVSRFVPAVEYINANRYRSQLIDSMNRFMKNFDVIITPSFAGSQLAITNLTGHPALCMPVGFDKNGSPSSITFLANLYDEAILLAVGKLYQEKTGDHLKHPLMFVQ